MSWKRRLKSRWRGCGMSEWKFKALEDIAQIKPTEKIEKGQIAKNIPMTKLTEFQRKIDGFDLVKYKSGGTKFRNGDTLVAKITPCLENGKTAFVDILDKDEIGFGSTEFIVLRAKSDTEPKFLYYLSVSPLFRTKAISLMEGTSGRKRVNENELMISEFLVPDLVEQKKIAKVLSNFDDKIELNKQINTQLEAMAKTLYDYWFVQFDFPDESGKPYKSSGGKMVYNETLKREIPEGWEVKKLGEYSIVKKGQLITKKEVITTGEFKVVSGGLDFAYYHNIYNREADIITVSTSGANAGFIRFWREKIFANDCITVQGSGSGETLYIYMAMLQRQGYLYSQARGSAQPHVYPKDVEVLPIIIPDSTTLKKFCNDIERVNDLMRICEVQNQELAQLRDWLLPMLMNGQVTL